MQYVQLKEQFKHHTIFSLSDIRLLEPNFHRRRLNDWQDKGYIKKIIKEIYIFSDKDIDEHILFEIANRIYKPSYISLEMALSYYQLIPESVYGLTSVSTRRTYTFHTDIGNFQYRTLKPELFFGYEIIPSQQKSFKIAEPEKAVLDFIYLNPHLKTAADFMSLRFNVDTFFQKIDLEKLKAYAGKYLQHTFHRRLNYLILFMRSQKDIDNA
jgi:predicted transcriptional regulator of viral defense system